MSQSSSILPRWNRFVLGKREDSWYLKVDREIKLGNLLNQPMSNQTLDAVKRLKKAAEVLCRKYPVKRFGLFGSMARGEATSVSDWDVLVEVDPSIGLRFVELGLELEALIGEKVDLVSKRSIRPEMWRYVEKDLIYV